MAAEGSRGKRGLWNASLKDAMAMKTKAIPALLTRLGMLPGIAPERLGGRGNRVLVSCGWLWVDDCQILQGRHPPALC